MLPAMQKAVNGQSPATPLQVFTPGTRPGSPRPPSESRPLRIGDPGPYEYILPDTV
jgi:hypothetical protein